MRKFRFLINKQALVGFLVVVLAAGAFLGIPARAQTIASGSPLAGAPGSGDVWSQVSTSPAPPTPSPVPSDSPAAPTFSDVPQDYWALGAIEVLVRRGVVNGFPDGSFRPEESLTRAQVAKMMVLWRGLQPASGAASSFPDVPAEHWASGFITTAVQQEFVNGFPDGTYRPEDQVTKAQLIKLLVAAKKWNLLLSPPNPPTFTDTAGHWVLTQGWLEAAVQMKVIKTLANGEDPHMLNGSTFSPDTPVTRAQTCVLMDRCSGIPDGTGTPSATPTHVLWPMFRHDLQHTGQSPYNGPQTPVKKWEFATGSYLESSPAIGSDGTVYVGSYDHKLYALNPDGSKKWEFSTGDGVFSSPAIGADGTVYLGSDDNKLYAINPNGSKKWEFETGYDVCSSPAIGSDGTVYVGSYDHKLYALNPDGSKKWEFATGNYVRSSPAIGSDGTVYLGSDDNKLYAINPNGSKKWEFATGGIVYSSPAIGSDGTVYVGSGDNKLYAINPNGSKKWEFATGDGVLSSPAIGSDGTVYLGSDDNKLYAINPEGSKKWEFATGDYVESSPAIGNDGTVYVGSYDNKLYALNPEGSKKWEFATGNVVPSSPAIGSDGTVYVGSGDNKLYAIGE